MVQRTSSPVPDAGSPFDLPAPEPLAAQDTKDQDQFASLGLSKQYPEVVAYLRERQEFYRNYMPDGEAIMNLPDSVAGTWWKCAATIIAEIESFITIVETSSDAKRQQQGR